MASLRFGTPSGPRFALFAPGSRNLALLLMLAGCTRHNNTGMMVCTPGEQRQCACVGGTMGVQLCNPLGNSLGDCMGCPESGDMAGFVPRDLAGADFSVAPVPDLAGADLAGADFAGSDLSGSADDLSAVVEDLAMSLPDLSELPDLAGDDFSLPTVTPCPVVMLVLDTSASMGTNFVNSSTSHLAAGQQAMDSVVDNYGRRVALGFTHFANESGACTVGITVSPEPRPFNATKLKSAIDATVANGTGNLGNAVDVIAADPNMHQAGRQGSFMIIYTDGAGNCEATEPAFSVTQIDNTAKAVPPIKTYIVAVEPDTMFSGDETQMTAMANAGQRQCSGGYCEGHVYWPVDDVAHAPKTLDLILNEIVATVPGCGNFGCFPSGAACSPSTTCCGTVGCKSLSNDPENCGTCGASCSGGTCSGSVCHCGGSTCPKGDHCCNGACCSSLDMAPPPDCVCNPACVFGACVATNCCTDVGGCSPTPNLCTCQPGSFGTCP